MKIEVSIPKDFEAERSYAVEMMLGHWLGLDIELQSRMGIKDYVIQIPGGKKLIIQDHFFGAANENEGYLQHKHLPNEAALTNWDNDFPDAVIIYGTNYYAETPDLSVIGLDIFASAFFMLTRWEEAVKSERDEHQRFPVESAFALQQNFLHRPVVDEYAQLLKELLKTAGFKAAFKEGKFELIPTHDVDHIRYWKSEKQMKRQLGGDVLKRFNPLKALRTYTEFRKVSSGKIKDPYDTFDWLMSQSEQRNVQSRFYFIAGGSTEHEGNYDIKSSEVKKLLREILQRGHIIGIHPSYDSFMDVEMLKAEKQVLEEVSGVEIKEGRQHYLRFSVPETWQNWEEAGLDLDSTMNYAGYEGFRCGTGREFPVFNIKSRKKLRLKERPLILMDSNPVVHQFNNINKNYEEVNDYFLGQAQAYQMPLTVLFHNSVFAMYQKYNLKAAYSNLLSTI
jgi:hypothetical protein